MANWPRVYLSFSARCVYCALLTCHSHSARPQAYMIICHSHSARQQAYMMVCHSHSARQKTYLMVCHSHSARQKTSMIVCDSHFARLQTFMMVCHSHSARLQTSWFVMVAQPDDKCSVIDICCRLKYRTRRSGEGFWLWMKTASRRRLLSS